MDNTHTSIFTTDSSIDTEEVTKFKKLADDLISQINQQPVQVVALFKEYVNIETEAMLGLSPLAEEDIEALDHFFSDDLWDLWEKSNDHCYFCSNSVDPNEEKYGDKRKMCLACLMKFKAVLKKANIKDKHIKQVLSRLK